MHDMWRRLHLATLHRLLWALILSLILSACATSSLPEHYALNPRSGKGLVVGSITYAGKYAGYAVLYHQRLDGPEGLFESGRAQVLLPYFPAGEYEITSWRVGSGGAKVTPTEPFSIWFRVLPGKAVNRKGSMVTAVTADYRDMQDRDVAALRHKYPQLSSAPVDRGMDVGPDIRKLGGQYQTSIKIAVPIIY